MRVKATEHAIARFYARWAAPAIALYLVSALLLRSFASPWLLVGWTALALAAVFAARSAGPRQVAAAMALLLLAHAAAIPGSIFWGSGNWELTAAVLLWMAPSALLYLTNINASQVFMWLTPAWLIHSAMIIYEGFTEWHVNAGTLVRDGHATGLANNPNLAAGFLALGIVYLMTTSNKWLSLPLLMALLFTGSRWGLVVTLVVVVGMGLAGTISWRPLVAAIAAGVAAVMAMGLFSGSYAVAGMDSVAAVVNSMTTDVGTRLAVPHIPTFLPSGIAEHPGLHNVPLRIAVESGIVAAGLWVGITLLALGRRRGIDHHPHEQNGRYPQSYPRHESRHRWLLLTLVLLSLLDYYTWMGHLGGFWWLLIGVSVKGATSLPTATTSAYANASALPAYRLSGGWLPKWVTPPPAVSGRFGPPAL